MNRRLLLAGSAAGATGCLLHQRRPAARKTVAAVCTVYTSDASLVSHASVIYGALLDGYYPNGVATAPRSRIVSLHAEQVPPNDLSRGLAARHGFRISPTVADALTLGTGRLAVDAVLLVGEHGDYPRNDRGQKLYPRHELFAQIVDVFRASGRVVPVFCDKHLSYSWSKARQMYDWSRELGFPLMAGSSIPVDVRVPPLEIPYGAAIEHAVGVGMGHVEDYGFHTLEGLQCMVERRAGGETGVAAVEMLTGDAVWRWRDSDAGAWSAPLLQAALRADPRSAAGRPEDNAPRPALFLLEYRDGLRAAVYMLQGHARSFLFAGKLAGRADILATRFGKIEREPAPGPRRFHNFDALVHCIEEFFASGRPLYPVERTLLTTGALAFLFESLGSGRVATPALAIAYRAPEHVWFQTA